MIDDYYLDTPQHYQLLDDHNRKCHCTICEYPGKKLQNLNISEVHNPQQIKINRVPSLVVCTV